MQTFGSKPEKSSDKPEKSTGRSMTGRASRGRKQLDAAVRAVAEGRLPRALELFDSTMTWAVEHGDSDLWDRALCNRFAVEVELGEATDALGELRQIVLRSKDPENAFLAAYNVARAYDRKKDYARALFYARIARGRCDQLDRSDWLGWSHNQTGNLLLATSEIEDACAEFERALALTTCSSSIDRALILDNLGYCRILQGRHNEGFALLFESLRILIRLGDDRHQAYPRLALCYAYLDTGRLRSALRHGLRAVEIATRGSDHEAIKNGHYLLGETYNQLGQDETARDYFVRLQQRYYPDAPHVPDLLLTIDVRPLLNLRA